jgi:hypothetical protein
MKGLSMKTSQFATRSYASLAKKFLLTALLIFTAHAQADNSNTSGQDLLPSISGAWHSVNGYVLNYNGSVCYTTQGFYLNSNGSDSANFSYSFSCSTGYQGQMQGLDFNPKFGSYQNGYNTIFSQFIYNNNQQVGLERKMTTTWGFGSMINFQYQTVRITVSKRDLEGRPEQLSFEVNNSQSNVQNGQATIYHLELIRN